MLNTQPSILGQQPLQMVGPGYSGPQYGPGSDGLSMPQASAGWAGPGAAVAHSMPMQMHNHPYMPPSSMPSEMGPAGMMQQFHGQNGLPHAGAMPHYRPQ